MSVLITEMSYLALQQCKSSKIVTAVIFVMNMDAAFMSVSMVPSPYADGIHDVQNAWPVHCRSLWFTP